MKFAEQIERLQYLDQLIRKQKTGSPAELAGRLDISRSQLYNLIGYLNDIGMKIRFSRMRNSFYYECPDKDLEIQFSIKIITDQKANTIYGGGFVVLPSMKTKCKGYDQVYC
ncbi:MAG: HTH domain-containing protein [Balneolaceae bacterium]|nr:MAG: HTH domain-containing protein [Balneolaceae bacterium]